MVLTNYSPAQVIVVLIDGFTDFTIEIGSVLNNPRDITCIDSNTIAVSVVNSANQGMTSLTDHTGILTTLC
jgi:hypothetical protein